MNDKASRDPIPAADPDQMRAHGGAGVAEQTPLDASEILASVGEALYRWDIKNDVLTWSANAADVLLVRDSGAIGGGRAYAQLLEPDNAQAPFDAIVKSAQRDEGQGVAYRIQYAIRPDAGSETRLWVEDAGRWFAGPDGKPAHAHGTIHVINERHERERRLEHLTRRNEAHRRIQPLSPDRNIGQDARGCRAVSFLLRLLAGRHR